MGGAPFVRRCPRAPQVAHRHGVPLSRSSEIKAGPQGCTHNHKEMQQCGHSDSQPKGAYVQLSK